MQSDVPPAGIATRRSSKDPACAYHPRVKVFVLQAHLLIYTILSKNLYPFFGIWKVRSLALRTETAAVKART
jgi:hypothetical protein